MVKIGPFSFIVGSGHVVSETREVRDFDTIVLGGSGAVFVTQTGEESLVVEADDNVLPLVTSEVRGGRLELGMRSGLNITMQTQVRYHITVKDLRGLVISGSGKVRASAIATDALDVTISGSGSIVVAGQAARQDLTISGSGAYDAAELATGAARVRVSGAGSATINVRESLDVRISGSGSIRYLGQPVVTKAISGSGSIRQQG